MVFNARSMGLFQYKVVLRVQGPLSLRRLHIKTYDIQIYIQNWQTQGKILKILPTCQTYRLNINLWCIDVHTFTTSKHGIKYNWQPYEKLLISQSNFPKQSLTCFHQTRIHSPMVWWLTENPTTIYNFAPTLTKFYVTWEGLSIPHVIKFCNCRCKIVDSKAFPRSPLIHRSSYANFIQMRPGFLAYHAITSFYKAKLANPYTFIWFQRRWYCLRYWFYLACVCIISIR